MRSFKHTIDVLVKAYMNDTLERLECSACAVGNICADALGIKLQRADGRVNNWGPKWHEHMHENKRTPVSFKQIESTGYSMEELRLIEKAFMGYDFNITKEQSEDKFESLMRTVDELARIHGIDLTVREETKKLFVKA